MQVRRASAPPDGFLRHNLLGDLLGCNLLGWSGPLGDLLGGDLLHGHLLGDLLGGDLPGGDLLHGHLLGDLLGCDLLHGHLLGRSGLLHCNLLHGDLLHCGFLGSSGLLDRGLLDGSLRRSSSPAGGSSFGELTWVGDHLAELGAGLELRDGGLLDLDARAGARVATGPCRAHYLLERAEAGDADLAALGDLADDDVEYCLDSIGRSLLAAETTLEGFDQLSLVHVFPSRGNFRRAPCPAVWAAGPTPDLRMTLEPQSLGVHNHAYWNRCVATPLGLSISS